MNKKTFLISFLVTTVFLLLAFNRVSMEELARAFEDIDYFYLIHAHVLILVSLLLKGVRWKYIFAPVQQISVSRLVSVTSIGLMLNNILPARLGEFGRVYLIKKLEKSPKSLSLATVLIERLFDGITVLFFLGILLFFQLIPSPPWLQKTMYLASFFYFVGLLFPLVLRSSPDFSLRLIRKVLRPLPERFTDLVIDKLNSFISGLGVLRNRSNLSLSLSFSLLIWICEGLLIYYSLIAFGLDLPLGASFLLLVVICLATMIPAAPGFLGTIQFVCVIVLALYQVPKSQALAYSLIYQYLCFLPDTLLGLGFLFKEGISIREIKESYSKENENIDDD